MTRPTHSNLDVDFRFHVRIPSDAPEADAHRLKKYLKRHEVQLAREAYARGKVRDLRWWEPRDGAVLSRPEALGSRRWAIGYTERDLMLRVDVPRFQQVRQWRKSLIRWETSMGPDTERQDRYGDVLTRLICEALDLRPGDLKTEPQLVYGDSARPSRPSSGEARGTAPEETA